MNSFWRLLLEGVSIFKKLHKPFTWIYKTNGADTPQN